MKKNKKAAVQMEAAAKGKLHGQYSGNDAAAQRNRILAYLREHKSLSTLEARHEIDVMAPAARIQELRNQGFEIHTSRVWEQTPEGKPHWVGRYHLLAEPKQEVAR
ncbi:hypothetical protein D8I24_5669 [Cupriavidus necator H850]|uniref:helix-turn-helix domain-containing protein n=1 Tax=Cupriavidus necator TaxID=106590 RepID=UPI001E2E29A9|nr:helix-turn-helix domain-containing protein [Cupriavidus necator]KAI3598723.1 hypothetical protein D8I24_5669 [Cupriavidus necator H850]